MIETVTRTERLLVMILLQLMKGATQREKIVQLNVAGLSNVEIANVLETTTAVVAQQIYDARKGGRKKRARKKTTKASGSE